MDSKSSLRLSANAGAVHCEVGGWKLGSSCELRGHHDTSISRIFLPNAWKGLRASSWSVLSFEGAGGGGPLHVLLVWSRSVTPPPTRLKSSSGISCVIECVDSASVRAFTVAPF